ncbi:hypothetical protein HDV03_004229 [Kappamyces sp. JEL0829]|nr:hypothetical protein HDV03_004229 [Kappamyces sp. JEL0829]
MQQPNAPCDWCRIKKKKCDRKFPSCSTCAKSRKPLVCTYRCLQQVPLLAPGVDFRQASLTTAIQGIAAGVVADLTQDTSSTDLSELSLEAGQIISAEFYPNLDQDSELQILRSHLLELAFVYFPNFSCHANAKTISCIARIEPLAPILEDALCYRSCFFSNHPFLRSQIPLPKMEVARALFGFDVDQVASDLNWTNTRVVLDTCRAIFSQSQTCFSLTELDRSLFCIRRGIDLLRRAKILKNCGIAPLFDDGRDLNFTLWETAEARHILIEAAFLDTYGQLVTGNQWCLSLDDFPAFDGSLLPQNNEDGLLSKPRMYSDLELFMDSIWSKTNYFPVFEKMRHDLYTQSHLDSFSFTRLQLSQLHVYRRVVRFYQTPNGNRDEQAQLHTSLLRFMTQFGYHAAFADLNLFMDENVQIPLSKNTFTYTGLEILMMLALVHAKSATSQPLFSSSLNSSLLYTSKQILLAIMRALCFTLVSSAGNPSQDQVVSPNFVVGRSVCVYVASRVVCTSPVLAVDPESLVQAVTLVSIHVFPTLDLLGNTLPIAGLLSRRLDQELFHSNDQ